MNILGFGGGSNQIKPTSSVGITEPGRREASRFSSRGDTFTLLSVLEDRSPQTISQVASEAQMPVGEAIQRMKTLQKQGYIRFTGE